MKEIEILPGFDKGEDVYYTDIESKKTNTPPQIESFLELKARIEEFNREAKQAVTSLATFEGEINDPNNDDGVDLDVHDSLVRRHERTRDAIFWIAAIATVTSEPDVVIAILDARSQLVDLHNDDVIIALGAMPFLPEPSPK